MEETPDRGWSEIENITVMLDAYNWPQNPAIAVDNEEVVHSFWYQEFADGMMEPTGEDTYYKTRSGGSWSDQSYILAEHVGKYTALTLEPTGHPAFVWVEELAADNRDVFLARYRDPADVAWNTTDAAPSLMVRPNPCRMQASIEFALDRPERAWLDIYDVTGRLVTRLADGIHPAGRRSLLWNGRDARGRRVPSAVYHARLMFGGHSASATIVLIE